jgi:hypothetical protein
LHCLTKQTCHITNALPYEVVQDQLAAGMAVAQQLIAGVIAATLSNAYTMSSTHQELREAVAACVA